MFRKQALVAAVVLPWLIAACSNGQVGVSGVTPGTSENALASRSSPEDSSGSLTEIGTSAAARITDTFGGCQLFPTNDYVNLDVYNVPADPTSNAQIAFAAAHGVTSPQFPFESNKIDLVPYNAPTAPIYGSREPFSDSPWPIGNSTKLAYRDGMLPYQPSEDETDAFVQQAGNGKPCTLRVAGYLLPGGSPKGAAWYAYGGGTFDLSQPEGQYGEVGGGTGMSTSGIPGRTFDPRPDEFIKGIIPHAVDIEMPRNVVCAPSVANQYPSLAGAQGTASSFPCLVGGSKLRLKASFSDKGFYGDAHVMINQLQHYGGLVIDNGGTFGIYFMFKQTGTGGVPADSRDTDVGGIGRLFAQLNITDFEVVKMGPLDGSKFTYPGLDTYRNVRQGY